MASITISTRWITGRNFDLLWFVGAALSGYALVYLNLGLGVSAAFLAWFWIVSVDGPHVFGTLSRTYLDAEERRERRVLLANSLLWYASGPAVVVASMIAGSRLPFFVFLILAQLWAYWHVVRQHYGFLVLYQKKNQEPSGTRNPVDYVTFYFLMVAPFVSFLLRHPAARRQLGLDAAPSLQEGEVLFLLHAAIAIAAAAYVWKEFSLLARGESWNLPKNLFLLAAVPLHLFIFLHPRVSTEVDLRLFAVFVTYYHNIQYHGIVWFHNRNRYGVGREERFGLAGRVSRSFAAYYGAGLLFTLLYRYSNWFLVGANVPFLSGRNAVSELPLGPLFDVSDLAVAFWWGFAFHHYYLDQKIWKVNRDAKVSRDLGLQGGP